MQFTIDIVEIQFVVYTKAISSDFTGSRTIAQEPIFSENVYRCKLVH